MSILIFHATKAKQKERDATQWRLLLLLPLFVNCEMVKSRKEKNIRNYVYIIKRHDITPLSLSLHTLHSNAIAILLSLSVPLTHSLSLCVVFYLMSFLCICSPSFCFSIIKFFERENIFKMEGGVEKENGEGGEKLRVEIGKGRRRYIMGYVKSPGLYNFSNVFAILTIFLGYV